ncbi:hypothetical protein Q3G72_017705 [Acer saccharum]|nr:hypothetical protein Q3G72_017705 [Acer saccharum]
MQYRSLKLNVLNLSLINGKAIAFAEQLILFTFEDLNLNAVESLRGVPYLAIGKHLCGPATAPCCHHLCQWKHYTNKKYFLNLGITKEEFRAITWFTSWAVDADHSSDCYDFTGSKFHLESIGKEERGGLAGGVEDIIRNIKAVERAVLGFMCKQIIDMGRSMWIKECGFEAEFVKFLPDIDEFTSDLLDVNKIRLSEFVWPFPIEM